jgi:hypothetical protein
MAFNNLQAAQVATVLEKLIIVDVAAITRDGPEENRDGRKLRSPVWRQDCALSGTTTLRRSSGGAGWFSC